VNVKIYEEMAMSWMDILIHIETMGIQMTEMDVRVLVKKKQVGFD
jgi:hypothetical protein